MSDERKKILDMLANGKISADDAERLLDKLGKSRTSSEGPADAVVESSPPKYLRVVVNSAERNVVNVRVPLALVRTGLKLTTMVPEEVNSTLSQKGIDLSQLSGLGSEELLEALRELKVDVDSGEGDKVRIFCE